jgi:hypothetical protein
VDVLVEVRVGVSVGVKVAVGVGVPVGSIGNKVPSVAVTMKDVSVIGSIA